ncbi:exocyst complex component EXO70C2-like [Miscanthus floridulus]|uniref:exocyst complex component EXO70C2-like n=1 Tax=Miscanthus floridulus TaxID=154761 RepID=UPI003459D783
MAATGRDAGGRGTSLPWSYRLREQTGRSNSYDNSISSSSSGTIVSTTYTSSGSGLSSISMYEVRHFELALGEDTELVRPTKKSCIERDETMKHMDIKSLVQEFFGAPSAERSININSNSGDMSVLERWFSDLGVAWVLHLPDGDDACAELHHTSAAAAERWIHGLHRILEISFGACVEEDEDQPVPESDKRANNVPFQIPFARFAKEAMLKMLPFVDMAIRQVVVCINGMPPAPAPYKKLHTLLAVYKALSDARDKIWSTPDSTFAGAKRKMDELLSAKREEVGDAIWSTMETIRTRVLGSIDIEYVDDGSSSSPIPQASSDIHKATLSVLEYINFISSNRLSMEQIVSKAVSLGKYVTLNSMIMNMKSCLDEKLVNMSESFLDQGLRFLFLLNNFDFIRQSLMHNHFFYWLQHNNEVEGYMENYLEACWEPVFSCLFSRTPLCFGINHSPLPKFESEFNKTYASQKLWKVPDPKLRKRLRTAITKKIVPGYTEYIEENNITPGVAPQDLEKMLQDLFEG